jgi:hypothetical protein
MEEDDDDVQVTSVWIIIQLTTSLANWSLNLLAGTFSQTNRRIQNLPVITFCTYRAGRRAGPQEVEVTAITCPIRTLRRKLHCAPPLLVWVTVQCDYRRSALGAWTCRTEIADTTARQTTVHFCFTQTAFFNGRSGSLWNSIIYVLKHSFITNRK